MNEKMHKDKLNYKITFIVKRILIILFLTLPTAIVLASFMLMMYITIALASISYKEDKVEVKKYQLITSSDEVLINEKVILLFKISKYVENDNLMYKYYYLSEDNNELLTATCPVKGTKITFIEEGQESYVEITTITKPYMVNELKEPKVYEHICSELGHDENSCEYAPKSTYKIYAPSSAFSDIG